MLKFLRARGLRLLDRNFRCRFGEIDLIMMDGRCLVFIEVRMRKHNRFSLAAETVGSRKQRRLILAARQFLATRSISQDLACRFDVVGVDQSPSGESELDWRRDAFRAD